MLIYTEDKVAIKYLTSCLGEPHAQYFDMRRHGKRIGAHWTTNRTFLRKAKKRLKQAKIEIYIS